MSKTVGIKFRNSQRIQHLSSAGFVLKKGDKIIVMTDNGPLMGEVFIEPKEMPFFCSQNSSMEVFRLPLEEEIKRHEQNCILEERVYRFCEKKIKENHIPMFLSSVERLFDESKIVVSFTADGRVDFRELLKALVETFNVKIEIRQIGVRQKASMKGGLGPCGRILCCSSFLNDFVPVTIKMAKIQNVSLNPGKISGMCGRLMCCLSYEYDFYEKTKKKFPALGSKVGTKKGVGKVIRQDALKGMVTVMLESGELFNVVAEKDLVENVVQAKKRSSRRGKKKKTKRGKNS